MAFRYLEIDPAAETERITSAVRRIVGSTLKRRGAIVAMSGGIDSSVCAALAVRALGAERVVGLFLPEQDSAPDTLDYSALAAGSLGIRTLTEDITPLLNVAGY